MKKPAQSLRNILAKQCVQLMNMYKTTKSSKSKDFSTANDLSEAIFLEMHYTKMKIKFLTPILIILGLI